MLLISYDKFISHSNPFMHFPTNRVCIYVTQPAEAAIHCSEYNIFCVLCDNCINGARWPRVH
jgi:hypothetical protein